MAGRQYLVANVAWTSSPNILETRLEQLLVVDESGYVAFLEPLESEESRRLLVQENVKESDLHRLSPYGFLLPAFVVSRQSARVIKTRQGLSDSTCRIFTCMHRSTYTQVQGSACH